jgi:hypothetical protein
MQKNACRIEQNRHYLLAFKGASELGSGFDFPLCFNKFILSKKIINSLLSMVLHDFVQHPGSVAVVAATEARIHGNQFDSWQSVRVLFRESYGFILF